MHLNTGVPEWARFGTVCEVSHHMRIPCLYIRVKPHLALFTVVSVLFWQLGRADERLNTVISAGVSTSFQQKLMSYLGADFYGELSDSLCFGLRGQGNLLLHNNTSPLLEVETTEIYSSLRILSAQKYSLIGGLSVPLFFPSRAFSSADDIEYTSPDFVLSPWIQVALEPLTGFNLSLNYRPNIYFIESLSVHPWLSILMSPQITSKLYFSAGLESGYAEQDPRILLAFRYESTQTSVLSLHASFGDSSFGTEIKNLALQFQFSPKY